MVGGLELLASETPRVRLPGKYHAWGSFTCHGMELQLLPTQLSYLNLVCAALCRRNNGIMPLKHCDCFILQVFAGESELTMHNMKLGELTFVGLPAKPAGTVKVGCLIALARTRTRSRIVA